MRIGIDGRVLSGWDGGAGGGIGQYAYLLIWSLLEHDRQNDYILFLERETDSRLCGELIGRGARATVRHFPFGSLGRSLPFVYAHMAVSAAFDRAGLDLLHAPANALPLFYRRPAVVTVHDLAIYDHPEWFPSSLPGSLGFSERVVVPHSVRQAKRVIAVSESTKGDLERIFGLPSGKTDVIPEGTDVPSGLGPAEAAGHFGLSPKGYFLCLGTVEPRKNVPAAAAAFVRFVLENPESRAGIGLAVAGRLGWKFEPTIRAIGEANRAIGEALGEAKPKERVRHIGPVSREEKPGLMAGAIAFLFPSLHEGFGLPPLEAMGLGVPVIASDRGALPETCGQAAVLVDPDDVSAMAVAMGRIFADPPYSSALSRAGLVRAGQLTWRQAAQETVRTYRRAVAGC